MKKDFRELVSTLDLESAKTDQETAVAKITLWKSFPRRPRERIRHFWIRYGKLESALRKAGIELPTKVIYRKLIGALKLVRPQVGLLLITLESKNVAAPIPDLKRISLKISESTFIEPSVKILLAIAEASGDKEDPNLEQNDEDISNGSEILERSESPEAIYWS